MGESGPVIVVPGVSKGGDGEKVQVKSRFEDRGMRMRKESEVITPAYYAVVLEDGVGGEVLVEQSASALDSLTFFFQLYPTRRPSLPRRPPSLHIYIHV